MRLFDSRLNLRLGDVFLVLDLFSYKFSLEEKKHTTTNIPSLV